MAGLRPAATRHAFLSTTSETPAADAEAEADATPPPTIESLQEKVAELEAKAAENHNKYLRALADMDNVRRRAQNDVDNAKKFSVKSMANDLLEVADNLGRATSAVPEHLRLCTVEGDEAGKQLASLYEGVMMTETSMLNQFSKHGIVRFRPDVGGKFDPDVHMAAFKVKSADGEVGAIGAVATDGYMLKERLLRAAVVGVFEKA